VRQTNQVTLMSDLTRPALIKVKAALFLLLGISAGSLLIVQHPTWKTVALLLITIWSFCRLYYFAFYVIHRYIDPSYRFSGIGSAIRHFLSLR
jgi:hypothetical protein